MLHKIKTYKSLVLAIILVETVLIPARGQHTYFSQYYNNPIIINPAFTGDAEIAGVSLLSRQQWVTWDGAPSSNSVIAHMPVGDYPMGAGGSVKYYRNGPLSMTGLGGVYAYTVDITESGRLSMGLQAEVNIMQNRLSDLELVDEGDPLFSEDAGLMFRPNVGFGFRYVHERKYTVHVSIPRLLNSKLSRPADVTSSLSTIQRIYYMGSSADFNIATDINLSASILMGFSKGSSMYGELSGLLWFRKRFGAGLLYRLNNTLGIILQYDHGEKFEMGYSFDIALGLMQYNTGTHELFLAYKLPFNQDQLLSPRRF